MVARELIASIALLAAVTRGAADTKSDFAKAVEAKGAEFVKARDNLLQVGTDEQYLKSMLDSKVPQEKFTAYIVLGWRTHAKKYRELVREGNFTDQKGVRRFTWSYDPAQVTPDLLPLMYEFLLKDTAGVGGRDAAVRTISFLARKDAKPDVARLAQLLGDTAAVDDPTRTAVAQTLAALPSTLVKADDIATLALDEGKRANASKAVVGSLMNGMIRLGGKLPAAEKDSLVIRLRDDPELKRNVGENTVIHTVGAIGGDQAGRIVEKHLETTQDVLEKRWALTALGNIGNDAAVDTLVKYADNEAAAPTIRTAAIDGLTRCVYTDKVGDALEKTILKGSTGLRERVVAIQALDSMHRYNLNSPEKAAAIKERVQKISGASIEQPQLRSQVDQVKNAIDKRR